MSIKKMAITVLTVIMLVSLFCVQASADWVVQVDEYRTPGVNPRYMNINGTSGTSPSKRYLTLYRTSAVGQDQTFRLMKKAGTSDNSYILCSAQDIRYAINRTSSGRAWMWDLSQNGYHDSQLNTPYPDAAYVMVSPYYGAIGYNSNGWVYFGSGAANWLVSGTPTLPLNPNNVPANPYI